MNKGKTQSQLARQKIKHRQSDERENARETSIAHELRLREAIVVPLSRLVNKHAWTENIRNGLSSWRPNKTRVTDNRELNMRCQRTFNVICKVLQSKYDWFNPVSFGDYRKSSREASLNKYVHQALTITPPR